VTPVTTSARHRFARESRSIVRIEMDGSAWIKPGAAIACRGRIAFERLPTLGAPSAREALIREIAPLVRAVGHGTVFCAQHGRHVQVVHLNGEPLVVVWDHVLAFEPTLTFEITLVEPAVEVAAGGLVVARLSGKGSVALATHGEPLRLAVAPGDPVNTDPHATVAWSGALSPELETDVSWRTALGHGGGQPIQLHFEGGGHVMVQPSRNEPHVLAQWKSVRKLSTLVAG
jgi:uncharacterized protein (AIM24 family)